MTTDRSWPTSPLVPTVNETVPPSCGGSATNMKWQSTKVQQIGSNPVVSTNVDEFFKFPLGADTVNQDNN